MAGGTMKSKTINKPDGIKRADKRIAEAQSYLENYIVEKILQADGVQNLADVTGIPRSTIVVTLRRRNILGLRKLAYRLAGLPKPVEGQ
jgi:hypothetical protein